MKEYQENKTGDYLLIIDLLCIVYHITLLLILFS